MVCTVLSLFLSISLLTFFSSLSPSLSLISLDFSPSICFSLKLQSKTIFISKIHRPLSLDCDEINDVHITADQISSNCIVLSLSRSDRRQGCGLVMMVTTMVGVMDVQRLEAVTWWWWWLQRWVWWMCKGWSVVDYTVLGLSRSKQIRCGIVGWWWWWQVFKVGV